MTVFDPRNTPGLCGSLHVVLQVHKTAKLRFCSHGSNVHLRVNSQGMLLPWHVRGGRGLVPVRPQVHVQWRAGFCVQTLQMLEAFTLKGESARLILVFLDVRIQDVVSSSASCPAVRSRGGDRWK